MITIETAEIPRFYFKLSKIARKVYSQEITNANTRRFSLSRHDYKKMSNVHKFIGGTYGFAYFIRCNDVYYALNNDLKRFEFVDKKELIMGVSYMYERAYQDNKKHALNREREIENFYKFIEKYRKDNGIEVNTG